MPRHKFSFAKENPSRNRTKELILVTATAALLLIAAETGFAVDSVLSKPIRIETGLVEGVAHRVNDVVAFKGIPYAAPPLGHLRWREPQAPARWSRRGS